MKSKLILMYCIAIILTGCNQITLIPEKNFSATIDGKEVKLYTLENKNGVKAQFTNFGGRWISMWVPDRDGKMGDVILGFDNLKSYMGALEPYHGAITGRVCGRINQGLFTLEGDTFRLANNDFFGSPKKNHLHGGVKGFHKQIWDGVKGIDTSGNEYIDFSYLSKAGEEGYPGNLNIKVRYTLTDKNTLRIDYFADTDAATIVNITNHAFFNMSGNPETSVSKQLLQINADNYIECDKELVPTGNLKSAKGTPIDFTEMIEIGKNISADYPEIVKDKGYAIAYVLNGGKEDLNYAAKLYDSLSGRYVSVYTNQPSFQLYNAWLMNGKDVGKNKIEYKSGCGVVLETQGFPDAPNHSNFPSITLQPGSKYHHCVEYRFGVEDKSLNTSKN